MDKVRLYRAIGAIVDECKAMCDNKPVEYAMVVSALDAINATVNGNSEQAARDARIAHECADCMVAHDRAVASLARKLSEYAM